MLSSGQRNCPCGLQVNAEGSDDEEGGASGSHSPSATVKETEPLGLLERMHATLPEVLQCRFGQACNVKRNRTGKLGSASQFQSNEGTTTCCV